MPSLIKDKAVTDIPQIPLYRNAVKLYLLCALAWDYTDTTLDIAAQLKIQATKKATRVIRQCRVDYMKMRSESLDEQHLEHEVELAELFEQLNAKVFKQAHYGFSNEIYSRFGDLSKSYIALVESVQQALTVIDAAKTFAIEADQFNRRYYPAARTILPPQIEQISGLLPEYAGDCFYQSPTRKITSRILFNSLKEIDLYDENGKV